MLKVNGFVNWEENEMGDDRPHWEVDDARMANKSDGKFDLEIDPTSTKERNA